MIVEAGFYFTMCAACVVMTITILFAQVRVAGRLTRLEIEFRKPGKKELGNDPYRARLALVPPVERAKVYCVDCRFKQAWYNKDRSNEIYRCGAVIKGDKPDLCGDVNEDNDCEHFQAKVKAS